MKNIVSRILPALVLFSIPSPAQQSPKIIPVVFHILHEYGPENIGDSQVVDAVRILNEDFRRRNPDTNLVIPPYQPLIADCNIEFRLATKDPNGNCTNGIEHIYTHKTNNADDQSKISQWPRDKYMNVWVVKNIAFAMSEASGYAYSPSVVTGPDFVKDGIMIDYNFLGSIGASVPSNSRVITHEVGHYLGLAHPGANGCSDGDGIADTPPTGSPRPCSATPPYFPEWRVCDTAVIENVQNFMMYSFCSLMFTPGQAALMNQTLLTPVSSRNNLWTTANLLATGTDSASQANLPLCKPMADFFADRYYVCQGGAVSFYAASWGGPATNYSWSFSNGSPATSSAANPLITFNTWGWQLVTLTAGNSAGSDTKTVNNYIFVSPPWYDYWATFTEDFENPTFDNTWIIDNAENIGNTWQRTATAGLSGTHSVLLNDYGIDKGVTDNMISPSVDLSACSNMSLNFSYACATTAATSQQMTEVLKVYVSTNCGATWLLRKVLQGTTLVNNGQSTGFFVPSTSSTWSSCSVPLNSSDLQANVRFRFEFTSGDASNAIYMDDINLSGTLGIKEAGNNDLPLQVYPNPAGQEQNITLTYSVAVPGMVTVSVTDILGREIFTVNEKQTPGEHSLSIDRKKITAGSGVFLLKVCNGNDYAMRKLVLTD